MRELRIPRAALPNASATNCTVEISLVDVDGKVLPTAPTDNSSLVLGKVRVTIPDDIPAPAVGAQPLAYASINLYTQNEIFGETYYLVRVIWQDKVWSKTVQVPIADGSILTWEEFVDLTATVPPTPSRSLPDPALLANGKWLTTVDHAWIVTDAPPGSGDMRTLIYDPWGVAENIFDASNLLGNLDGGVFT